MATLQPGEQARMYALGGLMRGGASRGGYVDGRVYITIGGTDLGWVRGGAGTLIGSLSIVQQLDEVPDTCSLRINGAVPPAGGELVITIGSQNGRRLFAGYGLARTQRYAADKPANIQADFAAVDYTWLLAFAKVTKQYRNISGTAIIQDLIATYGAANGFTTYAVQADLPALEITFTDEDIPNAITRLMRRLGGHWLVDYKKDIHAWIGDTDPYQSPPAPLTPAHTSLDNFTSEVDQTQALTRVFVEHQGSRLLAAVKAGETLLPVESIGGITPAPDTFLKLSYSGAEGGAMHLNFTGAIPSAGGSLVGPGAAPSSGPTLATSAGGAVDVGAHDYAFTWVTAAGETKPSPIARASAGSLPTPTQAPTVGIHTMLVDPSASYSWKPGDYVEWGYSYSAVNNYTGSGPISPITGMIAQVGTGHYPGTAEGTNAWGFYVSFVPTPDLKAPWIIPWHRVNGGPWIAWYANIENSSVNQWPQLYAYGTIAAQSQPATPPSVAPTFQTVNVSAIATGPASVTARKLYRTKANQAALLLVTTIANNTATTYPDAAADATLGAAAPAGDTSGLKAPEGTVNAGSTSVIVASTGPFLSAGGWALVAEQALRYTGLSSGALTGIPATGPGAVVGPIQYNTAIRAAPLLTGIPATGPRSIDQPLSAGHEVYTVVQVDDPAAQATLAARLGVANGAREDWIADRRLSYTEAKARGQATIAARPLDALRISYSCRDLGTAVGKTIAVNLPAPTNVSGTFRIQQVTIANFRPYATQRPTFHVQASSNRFTFEDWLRILRTKE